MHRCKVLVPGGADGLQPMQAPIGYQRQDVDGQLRLMVSVKGEWLQTMQNLIETDNGSYLCKYEERSGNEDGTDILAESKAVSMNQAKKFCDEFADFLEIDPRHNFIISNITSGDEVILDEHNFIFCTGDLDRFVSLFKELGLSETEISLPTPHVHQIHDLFDDVEPKFIEALKSLR